MNYDTYNNSSNNDKNKVIKISRKIMTAEVILTFKRLGEEEKSI